MVGTNWIFDEAVKNDDGETPAWYLEFGYESLYHRNKPGYEPKKSGH